MMDHDQRFKLLLQTFLREFLEQFFPDIARRIDFSTPPEWLSQEYFLDPPRGRKRVLDLVAKLKTLEPPGGQPPTGKDETLALIHIEIEGEDRVAELRADMYHCYEVLRRHYGSPVLPLALYLRVGRKGRGTDVYEEFFWEYRTVRFEYQYVGLPALDAAAYEASGNLLAKALVPMMRMAEELRTLLMARVLQTIGACSEDQVRKRLLAECVLTYGDLTPEQSAELERILNTEPFKEGRVMRTSILERWQEQGLQQGLQQGLNQGQRQFLHTMLESRFGKLSPQALSRLEACPVERLPEIGQGLLAGKSLQELGLEG